MRMRSLIVLGLASVLVVVPVAWGATDAAPCTAAEQRTFDELYKPRIEKARSRTDKAALGKELLAGAGSAEGGLRYLLLAAAKDLAVDGGDLDTAVKGAEQLVALKKGDQAAQLTELVELQFKHFNVLRRKRVPAKQKWSMRKLLYVLADKIADNAIVLGNMHRASLNFTAAEDIEKLALVSAKLVGSPKAGQLRHGVLMSQTLRGLVARAEGFKRLKRPKQAIWAYLDAGLYDKAAELIAAAGDETAALLVRVATGKDAKPADVLAAAKAWDKRSVEAKGARDALEHIRLARAAELYERYMAVGSDPGRKVAKLRLQAINRKLGDMLSALRPPTEWVYLVDLKEVSAKVGWGSFGKTTPAGKPIGIAGKKFATGLHVHASSRVVYSLRGQYKVFSTYYGLGTGAGGAASFEVVCDGKVAWKSGGMWSNHTQGVRKPIMINVVGVDKLELVTKAIRGGAGAFSKWGDPKLR